MLRLSEKALDNFKTYLDDAIPRFKDSDLEMLLKAYGQGHQEIATLEADKAKLVEVLKEAHSVILLQHATRPSRYLGQHKKPVVIGEINAVLAAVKGE